MGSSFKILTWWVLPVSFVASLAAAELDLRLVQALQNRYRDMETVRSLLKESVDVNMPDGDGATALHWAAHWDDVETADLLIAAGANVNASNDFGVPPLWEACNNGSAAMVEKLTKAGANANATLPGTGETVLMRCARAGNADATRMLLDHGADVNAKEPRQGQTALMWALEDRHPAAARVLMEHGADIHAKSKGGFTPFLYAARRGDIESAKFMLEKGVDINEVWVSQSGRRGEAYRDTAAAEEAPVGLTALLLAVDSGQEEFAIFLVGKGANVNATDPDGYTPLHYSLRRGISLLRLVTLLNPNGYRQPFSYLLRPNMSKLVKVLLEHGADVNARVVRGTRRMAKLDGSDWPRVGFAGATPFLFASASGDVEMMRTLIAHGADPTIGTSDGVTPLLAAAGAGRSGKGERTKEESERYMETVRLLIELGADVNAANINGMTPVHAAAQTAANEVLQFLVERGARLDAKDRYGQTALSIVEGDPNLLMDDHEVYYHANTAELIRKLGADPLPNPGRRVGYDEIKGINLNANEPAGAR